MALRRKGDRGKKIGLVSACHGRELSVHYDRKIIKAVVKGKLLEHNSRHNIVSGDYCTLEKVEEQYLVTGVLPRDTELIRFIEKKDRKVINQVLAANCDQILALFSFEGPNINPLYLDLLLCHSLYSRIKPYIIFNKIDIVDLENYRDIVNSYEKAGFELFFISVKRRINIDQVQRLLTGKKTVILGPSGSGKSSLLNLIKPSLNIRIGKLTKSGKGPHTTTSTIIYEIFENSFIYDTPGFGKMFYNKLNIDIVKAGYPEFFSNNQCEFNDCLHIQENNCDIKERLIKDDLSRSRYKRYYIIATSKEALNTDLRESIPSDTGLFISKNSVFRMFTISEAKSYQSYFREKFSNNWFYYTPFIYFQGLSKDRKVLIKQINGHKQVFLCRIKDNRETVSLFYINPETSGPEINNLINFLQRVNHDGSVKISFLSENDIAKIDKKLLMNVEVTGKEYIYDKEMVTGLKGRYFRDLKKKLNKFQSNYDNIIIRSYKPGDSLAIQNLYTKWLANQSPKYHNLYDNYYTSQVIANMDGLLLLDVKILIAELDEKAVGFIMGGAINNYISNAFVMKTDIEHNGLSYYLKYKFIEYANTPFINDGIDFGFYGLKQSKRLFCPVKLIRSYALRI